jgi:hypothetical protein
MKGVFWFVFFLPKNLCRVARKIVYLVSQRRFIQTFFSPHQRSWLISLRERSSKKVKKETNKRRQPNHGWRPWTTVVHRDWSAPVNGAANSKKIGILASSFFVQGGWQNAHLKNADLTKAGSSFGMEEVGGLFLLSSFLGQISCIWESSWFRWLCVLITSDIKAICFAS